MLGSPVQSKEITLGDIISRTCYLMDPEFLFEFAIVPLDFDEAGYDELWEYWRKHCYNDPEKAEIDAAIEAIKTRQNGWCSVANLRDAGFAVHCGTAIGKMVPQDVVQRVHDKHSYCPSPRLEYRDAW